MLINGHAHVFNLQSVLTNHSLDILRARVKEELKPKALGDAVADVLADLFEKVQQGSTIDEGKLVHGVLDKLIGSVDFDDLRKKLPAVARQFLDRGLDKLENALLFRLVDGLDRVLNRRQGDARSANVTDAIALLRLALQARTRDVALRLMHQLGPDRGMVALMMDITSGDGSDDQLFDAQTRDLSDLILEYPGRIFPFFAVHTRRPDHLSRLRTALTEQGFVGVKLYPALGSEVTSDEMKDVLRAAVELDAPLLSHTTPSGFFESDASLDFGDPVHWGPLLDEIADFRICFAHFGGSSNLAKQSIPGVDQADERRRWTGRILEMMRGAHGSRVFADVSYHESPMESETNERKYFNNLKSFLADAVLRDRVLFGTDSWVMRMRVSEGSYWRFFQDGVDTDGLSPAEFRRLSETNNHRFLGLPLTAAGLPMGANVERYVRFVKERKGDLKARPAPWLLRALGDDVAAELEKRDWPLADSLKAPGWKDLLETVVQDVLDTTVSGATGSSVRIADASFSFDAAPLGFQGDGELSLAVFNRTDQFQSPKNTDPDGVIGPAISAGGVAGGDPFAPFRQPAVIFDPEKAWLKYRAKGHLALAAKTDVGLAAVGLEASAEKRVVLADYRRHERSGRLRDLVPGDLRWPRFALDCEDVLRLGVGDAVSFQTHGRLAARVSVSAAEAFTFGLFQVARSLDAAGSLSLEAKVGASVSAGVSFEDDFRLVFARHGGGWRAEVRKIETRGREFKAEIGADLGFTDPDAASRAVASLFDQTIGDPLDQVRALFQGLNVDDLGPTERQLFDRVTQKLGASSLADLEKKVEAFEEKIRKTLDEVVRARLEAGFAYEYSRIETDTALLVADLDARAVAALHGQLVRGNLEPAIEWADDQDPTTAGAVKIVRYMLAEETVSQRKWGFSLQFGRWLDLAQQDEKKLVERRQRSRLPSGETAQRLTYLGSRSRSDSWMQRKWKWQIDLDARMDRISAHPEPMTSDFTYNLGFDFYWETSKLRQGLLDHILDAAALWGVLPVDFGSADALRQHFGQNLDRHGRALDDLLDRKVKCHLQLLFNELSLARILPRAKRDNAEGRDRMASAMAAAMPFRKQAPHSNVAVRRAAYEGLFKTYLEESPARVELRLSDYKDDARKVMVALGHTVQARREDESATLERMWTFAGMLNKNKKTAQQWSSCRDGLEELARGVGRISGTKHTMVKAMFKDMARFWGQTHHVRAFGAYMLDVAGVQGSPEGVAPGLRIEVDNELVISIGPPAP